jgi:hypothetical protein
VRRAEQQAAEAARRAAEREKRLRRAAEYEEPEWAKASEAAASDSEVSMPASKLLAVQWVHCPCCCCCCGVGAGQSGHASGRHGGYSRAWRGQQSTRSLNG